MLVKKIQKVKYLKIYEQHQGKNAWHHSSAKA
jgi:hypothetical protein